MGCASCSTGGCGTSSAKEDKNPSGCKGEGSCGCNKKNTYDWLSDIELPEYNEFDVVEVSFKNGARKGFYVNQSFSYAVTGDNVVVEAGTGYDVGTITLSGELVRLQMKKKKVATTAVLPNIIRKSNERDFERLKDARALEYNAMVRARIISRSLKLDMKIGDVEFQGDKRKATFYYTADGRVDFRELIKLFAKEFKVKIEMRQIGARQESARIGGLGSCGRELCCSTWLTDFKSVSTAAARYQNLAINQSKLSGQCGRLKCCLNYELDTYMDALTDFPKKADFLLTEAGKAFLVKTDIFRRTMYYQYRDNKNNKFYPLKLDRVKEILALNAKGERPMELMPKGYDLMMAAAMIEEPDYEAVNDVIELAPLEKKKRRRRNRNKSKKSGSQEGNSTRKPTAKPVAKQEQSAKAKSRPSRKRGKASIAKSKEKLVGENGENKAVKKVTEQPNGQKPKPKPRSKSRRNRRKPAVKSEQGKQPVQSKKVNTAAPKEQPKKVNTATPKEQPKNPQQNNNAEKVVENKNKRRRSRNRNRNRNRNSQNKPNKDTNGGGEKKE